MQRRVRDFGNKPAAPDIQLLLGSQMNNLRPHLLFLLLLSVCLIPRLGAAEKTYRFTPEKQYLLWDNKPAALDLKGWEFDSYPLGNGYFGVSFFGGVGEELWQFCEKSLFVTDLSKSEKAYDRASLSSLCEVRLIQPQDFAHVTGYRR